MNLSDNQLKAYSKDHIFYEVQMLLETRKYFSFAARGGWIQKMTTIESFVIHLRCLINFLYPNNIEDDDIVARHFVSQEEEWESKMPKITATLKEARIRANKEVGHLTQKRKGILDPGKPWAIDELANEVVVLLRQFCNLADENRLDPRILELLS